MEIILDKSRFPLVKIEPISIYIHVLPITKVQFEQFICDPNAIVDASFYEEKIVKLNPRTLSK